MNHDDPAPVLPQLHVNHADPAPVLPQLHAERETETPSSLFSDLYSEPQSPGSTRSFSSTIPYGLDSRETTPITEPTISPLVSHIHTGHPDIDQELYAPLVDEISDNEDGDVQPMSVRSSDSGHMSSDTISDLGQNDQRTDSITRTSNQIMRTSVVSTKSDPDAVQETTTEAICIDISDDEEDSDVLMWQDVSINLSYPPILDLTEG